MKLRNGFAVRRVLQRPVFMLTLPAALASGGGCAVSHRHDHSVDQHGQVYYLDGAGGGGALTNWGRGVQAGLEAAGYSGAFENHVWQTGFGVAADQSASVAYKRTRAQEMADEIGQYMSEHPNAPVNLIGLSAGTAVAVFTLEQLPSDRRVDNVVLLGSSLSRHYDLSKALRHVKNRMYVFTSEKDAVLKFAVSAAGTADRRFCGACAAGLHGFHVPAEQSADAARLYGKLENIAWREDFGGAGNLGGHTDATNAAFVRSYIAPLLKQEGPRFMFAAQPPESAKSDNVP
jgi:pimeloyl-ACP methyl ester carboxylesterase